MLQIHSLSHDVAGKILFQQLSYSFTTQKYGLVGPNGVGKTTLAKILSGHQQVFSGQVIRQGEVKYFAQHEPKPSLLLSEYLMEVWEDRDGFAALKDLIEHLDFNRRCDELSGGEWMKARLIKLLVQEPHFLILDEPTNNLDRQGKSLIKEFISHYSGGALVISHDREILEMMDVTLEMSNQGLSSYGGGFRFYWDEREKERKRQSADREYAKNQLAKKEKGRLEKLDKQEKRMRTAKKNVEKLALPKILIGKRKRTAQVSLGKLKVQEKNFVDAAEYEANLAWKDMKRDPFLRLDFAGAEVPRTKLIVSILKANWIFSGVSRQLWDKPIDLIIHGPQRWHIQGKNGSGKSTLIKHLLHQKIEGEGSGEWRALAKAPAYLDQQYQILDHELSVLENIRNDTRFDLSDLRNELAFFGFTDEKVHQQVKSLSGGEMLKAALAKMFLGRAIPDLVILDEPTNNLDLMSIELLEKSLKKYQGALMVISHDEMFVQNLAITHQLNLDDHRMI